MELQDFGERHSLSGQGLIADSGTHRSSAAGHGVSSFLEKALQEGSRVVNLLLFSIKMSKNKQYCILSELPCRFTRWQLS